MSKLSAAIASFLLVAMLAIPVAGQIRRESRTGFSQLDQLPATFEPNLGQAPSEVKYLARAGAQTVFLNSDGAVLHLTTATARFAGSAMNIQQLQDRGPRTARVAMTFRNSRTPSSIDPLAPLAGEINYLLGNDPSKWLSHVPIYGQVAYRNVYPGIDLVYHGRGGALEYDFVAKPGANTTAIQVEFQGADRISLSPEGDLILDTAAGQIRWKRPVVYQEDRGVRKTIAARYELDTKDSRVRFLVAKYDRSRRLIIDPQLVYGTLVGGSAYDSAYPGFVDSTGIYLTGTTYSFNFPTTSGEDQQLGGQYDAFVTKLNPQGNALIYSTYIGGSDIDSMNAAWLAPDGSFYLTGFTWSSDFPTYPSNVISTTYGGNQDGFVSHISADGTRFLFSTYLGGSLYDDAFSMYVDTSGNVYVTGETGSVFDFPITQGAYQTTYGGGINDVFVTKMNPTGTALIYSTFLGGSGQEEMQNPVISPSAPPNLYFVYGDTISVDLAGNAYIAGMTTSSDFPTTAGAYSRVYHGGSADGFVAKLNPSGTHLVYSTYLGGSGFDAIQTNQLFPDGSLLIAGMTSSADFPTTPGAYRRTANTNGSQVGFAARLDPTGSQLVYSTFFGGTGGEARLYASEGGNGSVVLSGITFSSDVPTTPGALQPSYAGGGDIFMSFFDSNITTLMDSTYLGTAAYDSGSAYFGPGGPTDVILSGGTGAAGFPTTAGAYQRTYAGGTSDAFFARFAYTAGCQETLSTTIVQMGAAGGSQTIGITAPASCVWFAYSNQGWTTYTTNAYGSGSGSVTVSVQANTGSARTAILNIAGTPVTVQQSAQGACTFTLQPTSVSFALSGGSGSIGVVASLASCSWSVNNTLSWVHILSGSSGTGNGTVTYSVDASATSRSGAVTVGGVSFNISENAPTSLLFVPVTPCRVADTRSGQGKTGAFGPPSISGGSSRDFSIPGSGCNIPTTAAAYSLNVTAVPPGQLTYLTMWPAGQTRPVVSTLNDFSTQVATPGNVVANAAIVPAGTNGSVSVFVSDTTDVIIDINGYFAPPATGGLAFYPVTPCRVADTRTGQGKTGAFGPPTMTSGSNRSFPIQQTSCSGIAATAQAYSLNVTVVPQAQLTYLTAWPSGQAMPVASTLNDFSTQSSTLDLGRVVANAAIVPAGTSGAVSVFVSDATDVIIDINGYFAPPGGSGALSFYTAAPCRVVDTRGNGLSGAFGPPSMTAGSTRTFVLPASSTCSIPASAQAYSLNMTVVPPNQLTYLTTWPSGQTQPVVSTLNDFSTVTVVPGRVVANAAIVPAGTSGAVSVFVSDSSDVIIDINGYFAP